MSGSFKEFDREDAREKVMQMLSYAEGYPIEEARSKYLRDHTFHVVVDQFVSMFELINTNECFRLEQEEQRARMEIMFKRLENMPTVTGKLDGTN